MHPQRSSQNDGRPQDPPRDHEPNVGSSLVDAERRCRLARDIASAVLGVPMAEIVRPTRSPASTCHARHVAMYLAHVIFQVPLTAISLSFGRDRTSVAHGVRRIEDRRDDAAFDALLGRLETLAAACRALMGEEAGDASDPGDSGDSGDSGVEH